MKTSNDESKQFGLSEEYWERLDEKSRELYRRVRPLRRAAYKVNMSLGRIEPGLEDIARDAQSLGGELQLCPDFQRGHVWDEAKQVAYVENVFRGTAPLLIRLNCAGWNGKSSDGDINPADIVCVDGLQRLTALRRFMKDEIKIFGGHLASELSGTPFDPRRLTSWNIELEIFDIPNRAELLQFYIDINRGGVVHSDEEIDRVRGLLEQARQSTKVDAASTGKKRGTKKPAH